MNISTLPLIASIYVVAFSATAQAQLVSPETPAQTNILSL